ncbi:MAG: Mpv17/PMP22 family protein [Rikenellaceae bacterium]
MKRSDLTLLAVIILAVTPFVVSEVPYQVYKELNAAHPYCLAFVKFAILSTLGELLGLRIKSGVYTSEGFGAAPRAILWGVYGVWIAIAMKTFSMGAPVMVESLGVDGVVGAMKEGFSPEKLLGAFTISVMMNSLFAPIFMTLHKITDAHIVKNGGSICSLVRPIDMRSSFVNLDWDTQWSFVFMKTIPYFWIPAHTITFMLPASQQVLFAALLSIALGVFLSIAVVISRNKSKA